MSKKNRNKFKKQQIVGQQQQNGHGGAERKDKGDAANSRQKPNKKQQKMNKEKEFVEQFEERQKMKPAVSIKEELLSSPKTPEVNAKIAMKKQKVSKQRNDGESAVHVPIKQQLTNGKQKAKQAEEERNYSSDSTTLDADQSVITAKELHFNTFTTTTVNGDKDKVVLDKSIAKRKRVLSDSSVLFEEHEAKRVKATTDFFNEEQDSDDESGLDDEDDDLDGLAAMDDEEVEEDELEDEEGDFDSFIAEDEELEDGLSESEDSIASTIDLNILGYTTAKESPNCLVLAAEEDFSIATSPFKLHKFSTGLDDHSVQVGLKVLQWMLSPTDSQFFFSKIFQKRVLVVKRNASTYFDGFFNTKAFTEMLQNHSLEYGKDLNVASYEAGVRLTHNPSAGEDQKVYPAQVLAQLAKGRSVQCVHPQVFNDHIWHLCELLQEVFCSFVGANNYLTPANSAGFAPHWDDIDAFMLQVEGKKYWKVYAPESADDALPLESSANFTDDDFKERVPVFEGWLEQGDTLYVPRGFIHQARTGPDTHSHHVTVSFCRQHSYADFFKRANEEFIEKVVSKSKRLRQALPPLLLDMAGGAKQQYNGDETMQEKLLPIADVFARTFASDFTAFVPSYVDLMAREFFRTALPPLLSPEERGLSAVGAAGINLFGPPPLAFKGETQVRLVRKHSQRLLFQDEDHPFMVHRMANGRRYEERAEQMFDFPAEFEDGYSQLADSYPKWTAVRNLGLASLELNIELVGLLFGHGLLLRKEPEGTEEDVQGKKQKEIELVENGGLEEVEDGTGEQVAGEKKRKKRRNKDKPKKKKKPSAEDQDEERDVEEVEE